MSVDKILVTGAAGFIAHHVIEGLLRSGQAVVGMDNFDAFYERSAKEKNLADLRRISELTGTAFEFQEDDIRNFAFEKFDSKLQGLIHLAAKAGVRPSLLAPEEYVSVNVQGTVRLLEFARRKGIQRFVFGSSSSVYGDDTSSPFREDSLCVLPISPYAATKRAGELYLSTYATSTA